MKNNWFYFGTDQSKHEPLYLTQTQYLCLGQVENVEKDNLGSI